MNLHSLVVLAIAALATAGPLPDDAEKVPTTRQFRRQDGPIDVNSFFDISQDCYHDTRNIDTKKYKSRGHFYAVAKQDAHILADAATKWPMLGTDASDMYFGKDTQNSDYAHVIEDNLVSAREWGKDEWGFDPYIILTCDDPHGVCGKSIDKDPRPVACYVNNTQQFWGVRSEINCCGPFFSTQNIKEAFDFNKDRDPKVLSNMRTSGSYLLHEMMHTLQITKNNPHIIDERFSIEKGYTNERRIYGPKDCASAAKRMGIRVTSNNADSYATFASAMYWKDRFGNLPPPVIASQIDTEDIEDGLVFDNSDNYPELVPAPPPANNGNNPVTCAGTPADKPFFARSYASDMIEDYCDYTAKVNWTVDAFQGRYGPKGYLAAPEGSAGDGDTLWITVAFDASCPRDGTSYKVDAAECKTFMRTVLDDCNTDTTDHKYGGSMQAKCAIWEVTSAKGTSDTPPHGFRPTRQRPITDLI